jgi:predicted PurR-regulated permease PerM
MAEQAAPGEERQICVLVIAVILSVAALYLGSQFFIPIALALVLTVLFRPVVRGLERLGLPPLLGAGIVVLGIIGAGLGIGFALSGPVRGWIETAPQRLSAAEQRLNRIRRPMTRVQAVANTIQRAAEGQATAPTTAASSASTLPVVGSQDSSASLPPAQIPPTSAQPAPITRLLGTTTEVVGGATEVLLLLFLMLGSGGMFLQKLIRVLPTRHDKKIADDSIHEGEAIVLRYVLVTAMINIVQGTIIALIMWPLKMPSPILWGVFTFVLEFVPYLGATVMIAMLAVISLATFDSFWGIVLPPASYLLVTTIQNNLVSPLAYGRGLKLNPVAVLIGVLFWWFVWGVAGAFLAVPIIAMIKVVGDRMPALKGLAEFLGE